MRLHQNDHKFFRRSCSLCSLWEKKNAPLIYIYFFTLKWQTSRSSVFKQERFVSKCEAFSGSEQPRGRNETVHSSCPSFPILSLPPSFMRLLLLSLSPSTGKPVAAAARPRSVWLDRFYSRLPVLPFKPLSPQLCNTSETVWWKGDSLDSRVRPGAGRLEPQPQWASRYPIFPPFSSHQPDTSWQQAPTCIQKGSKEENAPLEKLIWLRITNE